MPYVVSVGIGGPSLCVLIIVDIIDMSVKVPILPRKIRLELLPIRSAKNRVLVIGLDHNVPYAGRSSRSSQPLSLSLLLNTFYQISSTSVLSLFLKAWGQPSEK